MRSLSRPMVVSFLAWCVTTAVAAAPPTAPSSAPAADGSLLNGSIHFTAPSGEWTSLGKTKDDRTAVYSIGKRAAMAVNVTPQDTALDDSAASKMGPFIIKQTRERVIKDGGQEIDPPRNEKDDP